MKVLLVHNTYQQQGGEDVVFEQERQLLEHAGHQVVAYRRSNHEINEQSLVRQLKLASKVVWASDSRRDLSEILSREKPQIAHIHNTFTMISPSVYSACREARVPVVQTLHNYRLFCPAATFFRDGRVCEECLDQSLWRGVLHGCYRESRTATSVVALMLAVHRWQRTWTQGVNSFIALSEFSRKKYVEGGIAAEKIAIKPNFVSPDPGCRAQSGEYALFVGRMLHEKHILTVLSAWRRLPMHIPLRIIGSGPRRSFLETYANQSGLSDVHFLGQLPRGEVIAALKGAWCLVFPNEWYENFPMTIAEAFACGVPVICSRLGAMQEIVADMHTGVHFVPGDAEDLARKVEWAWAHPRQMAELGRAARKEYEVRFMAKRNYEILMAIYEQAIANHSRARV
jgi:glycosyltransferase involved in cell wall biosynthesis